jgi:hypothetical protein
VRIHCIEEENLEFERNVWPWHQKTAAHSGEQKSKSKEERAKKQEQKERANKNEQIRTSK